MKKAHHSTATPGGGILSVSVNSLELEEYDKGSPLTAAMARAKRALSSPPISRFNC